MKIRKSIEKGEDGKFHLPKQRGVSEPYQLAVENYLTLWEELFQRAYETDELQFIFALLRFKGLQDAGWDTFENTLDAFKGVMKASRRVDGTTRLNFMLWLYGHIVEASDHYEVIANMVNIAGGQPYRAWNFPKIKTKRGKREQTPNEKILEIRKRCEAFGFTDYSQPFSEVLDKDLRNAVYHSDYSVHVGKVRFRNANGFDQEYGHEQVLEIINKALALHETIKNLLSAYRSSYTEPEIIDGGPHIAPGNKLKFQVIVRKKHGVIAVQEVPIHAGAMSLGIYKPGEQELIKSGAYLLPPSRNDQINRLAWKLPEPLAKLLIKIVNFLEKIGILKLH